MAALYMLFRTDIGLLSAEFKFMYDHRLIPEHRQPLSNRSQDEYRVISRYNKTQFRTEVINEALKH